MKSAPTPAYDHPAAAWLRCAAPDREQVRSFLQCGAAFAWSDDRWIIGWGAPEKSARPDPARPSFYAPDFFLTDPRPWLVYPQAAAVSPDGLAQHFGGETRPRVWREFDPAAFAAAFARVGEALGCGELHKAVPAVFETCDQPLDEADRARALRAMANLPSGLMPYGCWDRTAGVLGASPELLFGDDGVEVHTMAVAGTARAGAAPDEMMDDPKERSEHRIVLEDLAAQLAPLGPVTHGATRLWRIGILSHLRTDLHLTPSTPVAFDQLVRRLHPTPAVGTAPRDRWREWLPPVDAAPRGHFAAPFGLSLPGVGARCLVGIRNVQWDAQGARCGAGCGLVPASKLERETAELRLKLAATRGNLGL
jgi:menaquinone-specific isochorismate synthase